VRGIKYGTLVKVGAQWIVRNPRVQRGEPVIRGTRVPVRSIVIASEKHAGYSC
jgi:uncharacterized protein (DUF433 family)